MLGEMSPSELDENNKSSFAGVSPVPARSHLGDHDSWSRPASPNDDAVDAALKSEHERGTTCNINIQDLIPKRVCSLEDCVIEPPSVYEKDPEETCLICLDAEGRWDVKVKHLPCGRHYCYDCIIGWTKRCRRLRIKPLCPICFKMIVSNERTRKFAVFQSTITSLHGQTLAEDQRYFRLERELSRNGKSQRGDRTRLYIQPKVLCLLDDVALRCLIQTVMSDERRSLFEKKWCLEERCVFEEDRGMEKLGVHAFLGSQWLHVVDFDAKRVHEPRIWVQRALESKLEPSPGDLAKSDDQIELRLSAKLRFLEVGRVQVIEGGRPHVSEEIWNAYDHVMEKLSSPLGLVLLHTVVVLDVAFLYYLYRRDTDRSVNFVVWVLLGMFGFRI